MGGGPLRSSGGQIVTSVTAAGCVEVENLVCARREAVLTCSIREPCEERTVTDPVLYLTREPRVRELVGLPTPHSGLAPHLSHFPSGFQSPGFQACPCHCPGLLNWDKEAQPQVREHRIGEKVWVVWTTLLPGPSAYRLDLHLLQL